MFLSNSCTKFDLDANAWKVLIISCNMTVCTDVRATVALKGLLWERKKAACAKDRNASLKQVYQKVCWRGSINYKTPILPQTEKIIIYVNF